jgi:hypothetical protein
MERERERNEHEEGFIAIPEILDVSPVDVLFTPCCHRNYKKTACFLTTGEVLDSPDQMRTLGHR